MKVLRYLVILSAFIVFVNCGKKESTYKVRDLNGIRITENTGVPADSTFKIELREVGFIDNDAETDPEKSFRQASSVDICDKGYIFVLDRSIFKVLIYDKEGKFVNSFGGHGQGPGEFINPGTVNLRQDTVFVTDFERFKIHKFDIEGNFIESKQCSNMAHFPFTPSKFGENYITFGSIKNTLSEEGKQLTIIEASLYNNIFNFIKNLHILEYEPPAEDAEFDPSEKGIKAAASDINAYVYEHSKTQYKINVYDINGNKVREIRKYYSRIKIPEDEQKKYEEIWAKRGRKFKSEFRNSIYNLYADKYNRLWVVRPTNKVEIGNHYDVFENDIFINRIGLEIDGMPMFVGDKIVVWNWKENQLRIYDY